MATLIFQSLSAWGHPCAADVKNSLKFCQKLAVKIHHMAGRSYYTDCKPSIAFIWGGGWTCNWKPTTTVTEWEKWQSSSFCSELQQGHRAGMTSSRMWSTPVGGLEKQPALRVTAKIHGNNCPEKQAPVIFFVLQTTSHRKKWTCWALQEGLGGQKVYL